MDRSEPLDLTMWCWVPRRMSPDRISVDLFCAPVRTDKLQEVLAKLGITAVRHGPGTLRLRRSEAVCAFLEAVLGSEEAPSLRTACRAYQAAWRGCRGRRRQVGAYQDRVAAAQEILKLCGLAGP